ncbi:hypothetical protein DH2020_035055 [Rehmannia glutinosa]|uniref:CCHC-type domain-containing protein n=1 Tax=Rehmannia glutinosa TaxID=99300 RepID=A0ABR0VAY3_REHGL
MKRLNIEACKEMASGRERVIWNSRLDTNSIEEMQRMRDHIFHLENLVDELNHENSILYQQNLQLTQSLQQAEELNQQQKEHIVVLLKQVDILQTLIHQEKKSCDPFNIPIEEPRGTFDQNYNEHQRKQNKMSDRFKPSSSNQAAGRGKKIQKINHEMIGDVEKGKEPEVSMMLCSYCNRKGHELSQCWKNLGKCLRCGNGQHHVKDCPIRNNNQQTTKGSRRINNCKREEDK